MPFQRSTSIMWVRLLRNAFLLIVPREISDDVIFPFVSLDLAAMKRHFFVTKASDRYALDYILRFKDGVTRNVRLPAPLVFDFSRRNGYRFSVAEFDEIIGRYQYHDPTEGVEPDEGGRVVYPPA